MRWIARGHGEEIRLQRSFAVLLPPDGEPVAAAAAASVNQFVLDPSRRMSPIPTNVVDALAYGTTSCDLIPLSPSQSLRNRRRMPRSCLSCERAFARHSRCSPPPPPRLSCHPCASPPHKRFLVGYRSSPFMRLARHLPHVSLRARCKQCLPGR